MNGNSDNNKISSLRKFRVEECDNGFLVVVTEAKDSFIGRWVFTDIEQLCEFITDMTNDAPNGLAAIGGGR